MMGAGDDYGAQDQGPPVEAWEALVADELAAKAREASLVAIRQEETAALPQTAALVLCSDAFKLPQRTYPTCFSALNERIGGGVKARQLTVIAAPTGSGKTGLVGTMALGWAHDGVPVLWVGTEIDNEEQSARFASIDFRQQDLFASPDDFLSLRINPADGARALETLPLYIVNLDDPEGDALTMMAQYAAAIRDSFGEPPIIILDYLQVLAIEDEEQRRMSVTKVSSRLRKIARELNTPVVAISSVSRAYYGRNAKKPDVGEEENPLDWLAAAKDSGDIEFSSAVFAYLDTDNEVDMLGESAARLIVAKSRRGTRGLVGLRFHGPSGTFAGGPDAMTKATTSKANQVDDKVLRFVNGPVYQPMTKRQLRESVPSARATSVDDAVGRLIEAGRLKLRPVDGVDTRGRKHTSYLVIPCQTEGGDNASR